MKQKFAVQYCLPEQKLNIQRLLNDGHKEILQSECYEDYGVPLYIDNMNYVARHYITRYDGTGFYRVSHKI